MLLEWFIEMIEPDVTNQDLREKWFRFWPSRLKKVSQSEKWKITKIHYMHYPCDRLKNVLMSKFCLLGCKPSS